MTDPMTPAELAEIEARKPTPIRRADGVHAGPLVPSLAVELHALTFGGVQRHVEDHARLLAAVRALEAENERLRDAERNLLPLTCDGHAIGLGSHIWGLFEDVEGERFWAVAEVTATYESSERTIDAQMLIDRDTRIECEPACYFAFAYHPETGQSAEDAAREIAAAARATTDAKEETP